MGSAAAPPEGDLARIAGGNSPDLTRPVGSCKKALVTNGTPLTYPGCALRPEQGDVVLVSRRGALLKFWTPLHDRTDFGASE